MINNEVERHCEEPQAKRGGTKQSREKNRLFQPDGFAMTATFDFQPFYTEYRYI
jgi:hypothetical protein